MYTLTELIFKEASFSPLHVKMVSGTILKKQNDEKRTQLRTYQWRRKVPKSGGAHRYVIYVPSIKNQYKRVLFGYMVIY